MKVSSQHILELSTNLESIPSPNLHRPTILFSSLDTNIFKVSGLSTQAIFAVICQSSCAFTGRGYSQIWRMTWLSRMEMFWTGQHLWCRISSRLSQAEMHFLFNPSTYPGTVMEELHNCSLGMISVLLMISQPNFPSEVGTMFLPLADSFSVTLVPCVASLRMTVTIGSSQLFPHSHSFQEVLPSALSGFSSTTWGSQSRPGAGIVAVDRQSMPLGKHSQERQLFSSLPETCLAMG